MEPMNEFEAVLERLRKSSELHRQQWEAWLPSQPHTQICARHETVRSIDFDASLLRSSQERKNIVVYRPCQRCHELEELANRARWMIERGVPENLLHAAFRSYRPANESQAKASDMARRFCRKLRGFLLLVGVDRGTGKSHLAVAVLRETGAGRFITNSDLMVAVSRRYDDRTAEDVVLSCQRQRLLILDEIGMSRGGRDELPTLHAILEHRHAAKLPTVLTSNLTRAELIAYLGDRIKDRLSESTFSVCELAGQSHRPLARELYFQDGRFPDEPSRC